MSTNRTTSTLFGHEEVRDIVQSELANGGADKLLARTTTRVRDVTGISNSEPLPANVGLWVHRYWKSAIATDPSISMRPFTEAEGAPIELTSLQKKA